MLWPAKPAFPRRFENSKRLYPLYPCDKLPPSERLKSHILLFDILVKVKLITIVFKIASVKCVLCGNVFPGKTNFLIIVLTLSIADIHTLLGDSCDIPRPCLSIDRRWMAILLNNITLLYKIITHLQVAYGVNTPSGKDGLRVLLV